jgi:hypothetical protein
MSGSFIPNLVQSFTTVPVININLAVYALSIRSPGIARAEYQTYTFPLSPESLRKEPVAMTRFIDTQGPASLNGVQRQTDFYGLAPPTFRIQGTTGWQRHANDGFLTTGLQAIQNLEQFLVTYAQQNATLVANGASDLYTLEFYDYFKQDFWQVEPVGPQGIQQAATRTLLSYYNFTLVGVKKVNMPLLSQLEERLFVTAATTLMQGAQATIGTIVSKF